MDRVRARLMYLDCILSMPKAECQSVLQVIIQQTTKYKWGKTGIFRLKVKGIAHPKIKNYWKCTPLIPSKIIGTFGEIHHYITCLPMDSQWMGAIRMWVQTADTNINNPQVINMTPVHQFKSWKKCFLNVHQDIFYFKIPLLPVPYP